jgi:hypothetical protein
MVILAWNVWGKGSKDGVRARQTVLEIETMIAKMSKKWNHYIFFVGLIFVGHLFF